MRLRVIWLDDDVLSVAPLIDRYAFIAALAVGVIAWFAFRQSLAALAICLGGLVASIGAGIVRADLFANGAPIHVLLSAAGEIALVGVLSFHVIGLGRRLRRTALLRRPGPPRTAQ